MANSYVDCGDKMIDIYRKISVKNNVYLVKASSKGRALLRMENMSIIPIVMSLPVKGPGHLSLEKV